MLPLINGHGVGGVLAYRDGRAVTAEQFVGEAIALAGRLPAGGHVLNLCADRYRFTVGFAAALLRGQVSLLPPNETADALERIISAYPGVYCLSDRDDTPVPASLRLVRFPERISAEAAKHPVPLLPDDQVAVVVFTSGSTGNPVPYPKTWGSLVKVAVAESDGLALREWPGMSLLGTVPQQHVFGLEATIMMVLLMAFLANMLVQRGLVQVMEGSHHSRSTVKCDALLVDTISRSDTYQYVDIREDDVAMGHEATVSKISDDQLFYLMSRGLTEDEAMAMIVRGFVEPIARELPMEYALELNRLIELQMEGAVG